jgi:hypothetical protein
MPKNYSSPFFFLIKMEKALNFIPGIGSQLGMFGALAGA